MSFQRKMRRRAEKRAREKLEDGYKGPQVGDVCVGCVHKPNPNGAHYLMVATDDGEANLHVTHPVTKKSVMAKWILLCDTCFVEFGENIDEAVAQQKIPLTAIKIWREEDGRVDFLMS